MTTTPRSILFLNIITAILGSAIVAITKPLLDSATMRITELGAEVPDLLMTRVWTSADETFRALADNQTARNMYRELSGTIDVMFPIGYTLLMIGICGTMAGTIAAREKNLARVLGVVRAIIILAAFADLAENMSAWHALDGGSTLAFKIFSTTKWLALVSVGIAIPTSLAKKLWKHIRN